MRRRSLEGISAPTPVYVRATVASPNAVKSPVTGAQAAIIQWYAFGSRGSEAFDETIASGILGESVIVAADRAIVRVPTRYLHVYVAGANATPYLLFEPLPTALGILTTSHRALDRLRRGELYYREHLLPEGAAVRLRAVVAPHAGSGIYRTAADEELITVDELEHPTLSIDVPELA